MDRVMLRLVVIALLLETILAILSALSQVRAFSENLYLMDGIGFWAMMEIGLGPAFAIAYALIAVALFYWVPRILSALFLDQGEAAS